MLSKHTIRGRQSLAFVASVDAVALSYAFLLLLLSFDDFDRTDALFLAMQLLHGFTAALAYIVVRHSTTSLDTLRILIVVYIVVMIVDLIVLVARIMQLGAGHDESTPLARRHHHINAFVRLLLALLFLFIDITGAFFTNLAQHTAFVHYYSNDQLSTLADAAFYKAGLVATGAAGNTVDHK